MRILYVISVLFAIISAIGLIANPYAGILLITLFKPVIDTAFYVAFGPTVNLTQVFGALIPILIFLHIATAKGAARFRYMPLRVLWTFYAVDVFIFSGIIVYNESVRLGLDVFFRHLNGFIGFYMFQAFFHLDKKMKALLLAMIFAGIFPIVTTLYQVVTGMQYHHFAHQVTEGGVVRSAGLYFHILTVRYYCYQALVGMLVYWNIFTKPGVIGKLAGLAMLLSILLIIYKTYSKAGYLEVAMWGLIWFVLRKRYIVLMAIIFACFVLIPFYATDIVNDISLVFHKEVAAVTGTGQSEVALAGRIHGWGLMMDNWAKVNPILQVVGSGQVMTGAHNDYIMMLFHGGVFGLIIYLVLFGTIGVRIVRELMIKVDPLGIAALMLYLTFIVETVGLEPSSYPHFQWLVWGMAGLFLRRRQEERSKRDGDNAEESPAEEFPEVSRILQRAKPRVLQQAKH